MRSPSGPTTSQLSGAEPCIAAPRSAGSGASAMTKFCVIGSWGAAWSVRCGEHAHRVLRSQEWWLWIRDTSGSPQSSQAGVSLSRQARGFCAVCAAASACRRHLTFAALSSRRASMRKAVLASKRWVGPVQDRHGHTCIYLHSPWSRQASSCPLQPLRQDRKVAGGF